METTGVETLIESSSSITWADASHLEVDNKYYESSHQVSTNTLTAFTDKQAISEYELLFELHKKCPVWGSFCVPKNFYSATNRFFTHNLLPWLKVESLIKEFEQTALEKKINIAESESARTIYRLLTTMEDLSKMIEEILAKILQYRKG